VLPAGLIKDVRDLAVSPCCPSQAGTSCLTGRLMRQRKESATPLRLTMLSPSGSRPAPRACVPFIPSS
jgi:hypothetical protein